MKNESIKQTVTWDPAAAGIRVDSITRSPFQVREDGDEDLRALADDMAANGLVQPVTVRRRGDGYELIAGHRRVAAARMLGWPTIRAQIVEADDDAAERMLVAENFARRDLTPIEMADTAAALVERHGAKEAGRICGKSERWAQRMAYIAGRLSEDWRKVAQAWKLSQASLAALCRGPDASREETLKGLLDDYHCKTVDELNALAGEGDVDELRGGGNPNVLDTANPSASDVIRNFPWTVCGCGDCDGCPKRSDAIPDLLYDAAENRGEACCLDERCQKDKRKEWMAGRGCEEWSKKLGREVKPLPKHLNYWQCESEESARATVPVLIPAGGWPEGTLRWVPQSQMVPPAKRKIEKIWPTDGEVRDMAFVETVRDWMREWEPNSDELLAASAAVLCDAPIGGKAEYDIAKRLELSHELSMGDVVDVLFAQFRLTISRRALNPSAGQRGPTAPQMAFWTQLARYVAGTDKALAGLKTEAAALADQRIADVKAAMKAEKSAKRRPAR